jgi:RNA recognition motif-containing protein
MPAEELLTLYRPFGELAKVDVNQLHNRGIAFVSFFDKRSAVRAVEEMESFQTRGRKVVTGFAPHQLEGSELLVRPMKVGVSKPSLEQCRLVLSVFGEIEKVESVSDGFMISFFDIRSSRNALSNSGRLLIGGEFQIVELFGRVCKQSVYTAPVYPPAPVYLQPPVYPPTPVYAQTPVYSQATVYPPAPVYAMPPVYGSARQEPRPESIRMALLNLEAKLKPLS